MIILMLFQKVTFDTIYHLFILDWPGQSRPGWRLWGGFASLSWLNDQEYL